MNKLLGDNLEILKTVDSESVDLIYLDLPFFSNRTYEVIWGDKGEVRSFEDRWSGGIDHYIAWLRERVVEMHRVLKATGAIFLHCDWHANAHIRVFWIRFLENRILGMKLFGKEPMPTDSLSNTMPKITIRFSTIQSTINLFGIHNTKRTMRNTSRIFINTLILGQEDAINWLISPILIKTAQI